MAIMSSSRIAGVVILFVVGQAAAANLFHFDFARHVHTLDEDDTKCTQLAAALDAFWETLPDRDPQIEGIPDDNMILTKENIDSRMPGMFGGYFQVSVSTAEARHDLACRLAGVRTLADLVEMFPNAEEDQIRYIYNMTVQGLYNGNRIEALKDVGELLGLLKYFFRITGFPNFPLDLYDLDMARYFADRILGHVRLWIPNVDITEERKESLANALISDTVDAFLAVSHTPQRWLQMLKDYITVYADMYMAMSRIIPIVEQMGLLSLQ